MKNRLVITATLSNIPVGTVFKRVRRGKDITWFPVPPIFNPDKSLLWLTDDFVNGRFPTGVRPRAWYAGLFVPLDEFEKQAA